MHHTQYLRLISTLTTQELTKFKAFLDSPYFNSKELPQILLRYLLKHHQKWHLHYLNWQSEKNIKKKQSLEMRLSKYLSKPQIAAKLFPGEAYNDQRLRRVTFESKTLLEKFLAQNYYWKQSSQTSQDFTLLKSNLQRGELDLFRNRLKKLEKKQGNIDFRNHDFYLFAHELDTITNEYFLQTESDKDTLQSMSDNLDLFYILKKLRTFCAMQTRSKRYKKAYRFEFESELVHYVEQKGFTDVPLVRIYFLILSLEKKASSHKYYLELDQTVSQYKANLPAMELRQIRGFMVNFLIREARGGGIEVFTRMWKLFIMMMKEGTLYVNEKITLPYFNSCIRAALYSGQFQWAEDFIYAHEEKLTGQGIADVFDYSLLLLLFHKKEFTEVQKRIDQIKFKDTYYNVRKKALELMVLYEIGDGETFYTKAKAMKRFVKAKSKIALSQVAEIHFLTFIEFIKQLARTKLDLKPLNKAINLEILQAQTAEEKWLTEKVNELI